MIFCVCVCVCVCACVCCPQPRGNQLMFEEIPFCTDCALGCLICAEVAVDLMGPLLLWSWDTVWVSSSPANRDWHESAFRMFYSASDPLALSISISHSVCVDFYWFQSSQQYFHAEPGLAYSSWLFVTRQPRLKLSQRQKNICSLTDSWSNLLLHHQPLGL